MELIIDIGEGQYLTTLTKWASVSRTLNESTRLLHEYLFSLDEDPEFETLISQINSNLEELESMGPALNYLHQLVRNQIWEKVQ